MEVKHITFYLTFESNYDHMTFRVNVLKSIMSSHVQNMIENMILMSHLDKSYFPIFFTFRKYCECEFHFMLAHCVATSDTTSFGYF